MLGTAFKRKIIMTKFGLQVAMALGCPVLLLSATALIGSRLIIYHPSFELGQTGWQPSRQPDRVPLCGDG